MSLCIEQIAFERNFHFLFNNINCELHAGELLQVVGANGTGKSTLLRIVAGLLEPHAGKIVWKNQVIAKYRDDYQKQLNYLGHQNGIKLYLTVYENLQLYAAIFAKKLALQELQQILTQLNLQKFARKQARHLSAGQLRRLSLARLLINPATLWILDEPATSLDTVSLDLLKNILQQHVQNQGMAIIASHQDLPFKFNKTIQLC